AVQVPAVQIQPARFRRPFPIPPGGQPGQIILKDGKAKELPTCYSGAVRVQAIDDVQQMLGGPATGEFLVGLKVSPEPKIRWQNFVNLRLDKAVDDQDQTLTQAADAPAGPGGPAPRFGPGGGGFVGGGFGGAAFLPNFGTLHQYLPLRLKKGDKESKS